MSYLDLGYDDNLSSQFNSPEYTTNLSYLEGVDASQLLTAGRVTSPSGEFYIDFDDNHIEVDSINWDKGYGGTLTLGGLNNQNGQLTVKDALNTERVSIDKDGIVVKDDTYSTIIDQYGLVSTTNFVSGSISHSEGIDVDATTNYPADTQLTVTLSRSAKVLISASLELWEGVSGSSVIQLKAGTTVIQSYENIPVAPTTQIITLAGIVTLPTGSTLITLRNNGNVTLSNQNITMYYVVLGK